ncbi:hypothetical protein ACTNDY_00845 [Tissierellaceae bacterium HCP3S3_D8]
MRKFMKYEFKGTYKFILGILAIVILASTIIQLNIANEIKSVSYNNSFSFMRFMFMVSMFVIFGAFLTAFFYIVGSFRKELYEDRGYLTFTLPLTGNQILGAKLIVSLIWFVVLGIGTVIYNLILAMILFGGNWLEIFKEIFSIINRGVISMGIVGVISAILTLILIYLSMALSKVTIKNKKIGGLWFVLFLIINSLAGYIIFKIGGALPYYIDITNFKLLGIRELNALQFTNNGLVEMMLFGNNYEVYLNITGLLSEILICIGAFMATGYIIEKRIDL